MYHIFEDVSVFIYFCIHCRSLPIFMMGSQDASFIADYRYSAIASFCCWYMMFIVSGKRTYAFSQYLVRP